MAVGCCLRLAASRIARRTKSSASPIRHCITTFLSRTEMQTVGPSGLLLRNARTLRTSILRNVENSSGSKTEQLKGENKQLTLKERLKFGAQEHAVQLFLALFMLVIYLAMEKDEREVAFASQPVSKGLSPKSPRQSGDEADQEEQSVGKCGISLRIL
ncbi:PREDICTED: uncharacterized protein LOC107329845 [Acropora digitifera]|uniref:uncharacterized protein LOC107329845 n=1 Tax=Acropora digitifera TaxID=70779 RepID=UPI00077A81A0|nr:PREDICTED: uncharacterized protein LOC107329845 [Acropora digitifera]